MPEVSDGKAKEFMHRWSATTTALFGGTAESPWLKAQPKRLKDKATTPCLQVAGSPIFTTRPDGMYVRVAANTWSADVFCVEVCSSAQNLFDKRSRYSPTTSSAVLVCPVGWWAEKVTKHLARWQKSNQFDEAPQKDTVFPIRYLKVLFALQSEEYERFRRGGTAGHEYYMPMKSLSGLGSQKMQAFFKRMSPKEHFYIWKD